MKIHTAKCWICGKIADSSEHKIKKSNLVKLWGKGPYKGDNALLRLKNSQQDAIQGPDSAILKFNKNLCHNCNSTRTQPFDNAYDEFIQWFEGQKKTSMRSE